MNGRRVNQAFLISIVLYILCVFGAAFLFPKLVDNIITSNLICEAAVVLPGVLFTLLSGEKLPEFMGFRRIKLTTLLAIIPFTMFSMPAISLINLISQFFVRNEVTAMMESYQIAEMPFWQVLLSIGIFAPFCEEVICRGIYYRGYKRSGGAFKAMLLSALLFAVVHMNLNQAMYAFFMGIMAVLLVEATGSLWSSVIYHGLINSSQVALMYSALTINPSVYSDAAEGMMTTDMLVYSVAVYLVIAAVTLPLAWAILVWMSGNENKRGILLSVWRERNYRREDTLEGKKKDKLVTASLVLALILCVAVMIITGVLNRLFG